MVEKVIRTPYGVYAQYEKSKEESINIYVRAIVITDEMEIDLWDNGDITHYPRLASVTYTAMAPVGEQYFMKGAF